jgi:hypothetical protein
MYSLSISLNSKVPSQAFEFLLQGKLLEIKNRVINEKSFFYSVFQCHIILTIDIAILDGCFFNTGLQRFET